MPDPEESLEALSAALADSVTEAKAVRARHSYQRFTAEIHEALGAAGLDAWTVICTQRLDTVDVEATFDDATSHLSVVMAFPNRTVADPVARRIVIPHLLHHLRPTALESAQAAAERALLNGDGVAEAYWYRELVRLRELSPSWQEEATEAFAAVERERRRRVD